MKFKIYDTEKNVYLSDEVVETIDEAIQLMGKILLATASDEYQRSQVEELKSLSDFYQYSGIAPRLI